MSPAEEQTPDAPDAPDASKGAAASPPQSDYLTTIAALQPDKAAVIDDRPGMPLVRWTYRELEANANRLASALLAHGVAPGEGVIWCGQNSPWVVAMTHASRKAGFVAVPLNYRLSPEDAAYVIDYSYVVFVWVDAEFAPRIAQIRGEIPKVRTVAVFEHDPSADLPAATITAEQLLAGAPDDPLPPPRDESRTMIYTSGTTGQPKGAVRTGTGDPEQRQAMFQLIGYRPDDVYITTGPLYHSVPGGFMGIAYLHGQTVVVQRRFDPEDWLRLVETHGATSTFAAPTPIRRICSLPSEVKSRYDCSSMRAKSPNAPWPFALKQAYLADFPADPLWEVYGSTELGVNMIMGPAAQLQRPGSCGRPAPLVDVKLIAEDGSEVTEPGVPGEVFVRSRSVFDTYHKAQEKYDAETLGEFHTVGDIAYRDADGFYYICDRKKDMIISGGVNIYPAEIEAALESHPAIYEAAVFGIPSDEWGELVHAEVVRVPGSDLDAEAVAAFAREHLASYKVPRSIAFTGELPKTGSGKVLKRQLRDPYWKDAGRAL